MDSLDSNDSIARIDLKNVLGSAQALDKQCLQAWDEASTIEIPPSHEEFDNVIFSGMGGSGLGARIIERLYRGKMRVPMTRVNGYALPGFADKNTLVFCSSYSGTTEETLATYEDAKKRGCKIIAIASGGALIKRAERDGVPHYKIEPTHNPSNQPRMAIGYSLSGQIALAARIGLIDVDRSDIEAAAEAMKQVQTECSVEIVHDDNPAKSFAKQMKDHVICFVAAEHLAGAIHTVNNQFNENAKNLTFDFEVPELNHHLMEGLKHPRSNTDNIIFALIESDLYPERVQERFVLTKDVISQNDIKSATYKPKADGPLAQCLELIQFGAFANFYLAMLYDQDPAPIPWVDYFKSKLS